MEERNLALIIEYDGAAYGGFQFQLNAPTIQGEVEKALESLLGHNIRIKGASRTDAGVHAKGQVATFVTCSPLAEGTFTRALNYYLPKDIAVLRTCEVDSSFDARRSAISRAYRYIILNREVASPIDRSRSYHVSRALDVAAMAEASQELVGRHNMTAFTSPALAGKLNMVRTVICSKVYKMDDKVYFDIEADAYLPQQIRRTVGALLQVGLGKLGAEDFRRMVQSGPPGAAGPVVPAWGLYLMGVRYPEGYPS